MGLSLFDRAGRTATLATVVAAGLLAATLAQRNDNDARQVTVDVAVLDDAAPVYATAHEELPPNKCLWPGDVHRIRGHVAGLDLVIETPRRSIYVRDGQRFVLELRPGDLPLIHTRTEDVTRRSLPCEGKTWFVASRRHHYVCGNDHSPGYDASADVVVDAID